MKDLSEKARQFRSSARFYLSNRKMYEEHITDRHAQQDDRMYSYILEDLQFVENYLEEIMQKCGPAARLIIYLLYVENRTQEDVAGIFGITRRQLQYSLIRWMNTVFDSQNTVSA